MEELFARFVTVVATSVEFCAALFIAIGALESIYALVVRSTRRTTWITRKEVWVRFAIWLMLALEFELAADVLRSAISPSWDDIGQLAAIAVVRTFLNYFLEKDIDKYGEGERAKVAA
jgi:uncharacterized membrane protein